MLSVRLKSCGMRHKVSHSRYHQPPTSSPLNLHGITNWYKQLLHTKTAAHFTRKQDTNSATMDSRIAPGGRSGMLLAFGGTWTFSSPL